MMMRMLQMSLDLYDEDDGTKTRVIVDDREMRYERGKGDDDVQQPGGGTLSAITRTEIAGGSLPSDVVLISLPVRISGFSPRVCTALTLLLSRALVPPSL